MRKGADKGERENNLLYNIDEAGTERNKGSRTMVT